MTQLDAYYWHEVLHMSHVIASMCEDWLCSHPTFAVLDPDQQRLVTDSIGNLMAYYQICAEKQDVDVALNNQTTQYTP